MLKDDVALDERLRRLWDDLTQLRDALRAHTQRRFGRINPFAEDLFDWKQKGALVAGKNVTIYDSTTIVGTVVIGDHTWIGPFCSLDGSGGLEIGAYCSISAACQIQTHDTIRFALTSGRMPYEQSPVKIGNNCFLGAGAIVTRGVTIGDRAVIGAGAVITGDVPAEAVFAGVPAKQIGRVVFDDGGHVRLEYFGR
jgi:acetyltransferase-like isoleucine patch superfamily enzyme